MKNSVMLAFEMKYDPQSIAQGYVDALNRVVGRSSVYFFAIREPTEEEITNGKKHCRAIVDFVKVGDHWETNPIKGHVVYGVKKRVMMLDMEGDES